ncbi:helix-turn-helix domain-containing protein [Manganibacter manganicus]
MTVRRWIRQRILPAYRMGGQIRIDKADLIKFMRQY